MTATIVNAAPNTILQGTNDKSPRPLVPEAEVLPTHLPKIYLYTQKGPSESQLVSGAAAVQMYGSASFEERGKYATHATALFNKINAQGNSVMIERVIPADAGDPSSIRLSLDVLPMLVPLYERNLDGSIKLDTAGLPIPAGTTAGFQVKWVATEIVRQVDGDDDFGIGTQGPGNQTDVPTSTQSIRYPVMDVRVASQGSYGKNLGLRLWAPTAVGGSPLDSRIITNEKVYPFRLACVQRASDIVTPTVVATQSAEQFVTFALKPDAIDRNYGTELYMGDVFLQSYQELNDQSLPPQYGPFGELHVYDAQIKTLLDMFYAKELPFAEDGMSDFTGEDDEEYRFNLLSGVSSQNVPYHSFILVTGAADSVRMAEISTIYAKGGSDGSMSEADFSVQVAELVSAYLDPNSPLQNTAKYPESIIWDSGFTLDTKKAICGFIGQRKDTAVVLSTHDVLGPPMTASQESSMAIALRTMLQLYPESDYFGTPTMRGMIVGRSGKMIGSQYRKHLPLTLELASKAAAYMGAGNGKWKAGFSFDSAPLSEVTMFTDVNVTFTPAAVRNKDWANGLNWVENFGRRSLYFPALKTVYDNDTSVLNSFFTMMACVELQKVGIRAHKRFSGTSKLTNAQLIERVNKFVVDNTVGRFDNRFVITPEAYFTEADIARGYSWTLPIKIYANNMKTVMTLSVESYRMDDLAATT
ncbi:hypothetical protein D3C71_78610 [compost metagenome]